MGRPTVRLLIRLRRALRRPMSLQRPHLTTGVPSCSISPCVTRTTLFTNIPRFSSYSRTFCTGITGFVCTFPFPFFSAKKYVEEMLRDTSLRRGGGVGSVMGGNGVGSTLAGKTVARGVPADVNATEFIGNTYRCVCVCVY